MKLPRAISAVPFVLALPAFAETATLPEKMVVKEGFDVELIYSVPKEEQGSWVSMCADDKGRLIACDQYGALYRVTPPPFGEVLQTESIEKLGLDIGHAQGLCYHRGALYVVVSNKEHQGRGLYRAEDKDGDDRFDKLELLKKFEEVGGEHGPHAVIPSPDGESLYIACGNQTNLPAGYKHSRVPPVWGEDQLLPRIYGRGFMKGAEAPRGWVAKTDLDGKEWEIIATGFRNQYDIAFNKAGELLTFDSDMEWDLNTPWYRPTRVNHTISGAEFGWRNGSAKWPDYYWDSFGSVVDVGPGSPTGVIFGYGAKFPAKYQKAFWVCDWSYGKLYAVHLEPKGATYKAEFEEVIAGQPLPLTDIVIAKDGAMYFAIGGRRVQSGLYRVTYTGAEFNPPIDLAGEDAGSRARALRRELEALHKELGPAAIEKAWPHLASADRAMQHAARVAVEHQLVALWAERALAEEDPEASIVAIMALARQGDATHQGAAFEALARIDYKPLARIARLNYLRAYGLVFIRLGAATEVQKSALAAKLIEYFPAESMAENVELSQMLAYLGSAEVVARAVARMEEAPTQGEQIALAKNIRLTTEGWTPELQERYFKWFTKAAAYKGGASFGKFIAAIKNDAVALLPEGRKKALAAILNAKPPTEIPPVGAPRKFVKMWTMEDVKPLLATGLEGGRDYKNGRAMFGAAACFSCHRFKEEGGAIGPDLTSAAGKFSPHDLVEQIIEPSKEISDQYGSTIFTLIDGRSVVGRIANLGTGRYLVITDLYAPGEMTEIRTKKLKSVDPNPVSMMPPALLSTLSGDDILDLLAYVLSGGDPEDPLFEK